MMNKVISVVSHMGRLFIFMDNGKIYEMRLSESAWQVEFMLVAEVPHH